MTLTLKIYMETTLPVVEQALQTDLNSLIPPEYPELREMLSYHMGWVGEGAGPKARGKRLRPLLVLLSTQACGGAPERALKAASAVCLLHNFSLIHDDIEDNSSTRRGRKTVWAKWGMPQALNAGDLMFSMPYACIASLTAAGHSAERALAAQVILQRTIQELVQGQYLDMAFETRADVSMDDYWRMINGKTAALLSCCCELGALLADADDSKQAALAGFGRAMGLAFQVVDDWLGIWGDPAVTGKGVGDDLTSRKKTIPILYGLEHSPEFTRRWEAGFGAADVPALAQLLIDCNAQAHTETLSQQLTEQALYALEEAFGAENEYAQVLRELALSMTKRDN